MDSWVENVPEECTISIFMAKHGDNMFLHCYLPIIPYCITTHKNIIIFTTMKTSNLMRK
jgi:hypothetical protein